MWRVEMQTMNLQKPLTMLPSAFLLQSEAGLCGPATRPTLGSSDVQAGLAEP